jgi:hypothetical protein
VLDHLLLAVAGSPLTPFAIHARVFGNRAFAAADALVTGLLVVMHQRSLSRDGARLQQRG